MITLTKPLTVIDCETTGLDTQKDSIFSFAALRFNPDGTSRIYKQLIKPWKLIPQEIEELTGTTNEDVEKSPLFPEVAQEIIQFLSGCDLCGFNILGFDAQILWEEFYRIGTDWDMTGVDIVDAGTLFKLKEERSLTAAVKFYCGREHNGAHGAEADVRATADVFQSQVVRYELASLTISDLSKLCRTERDGAMKLDLAGAIVRDKNGVPRYTHKKVRGVAVEDDPTYAGWMLRSDFSEQTKRVIRAVLAEIESKGQGALL